MEDEEDVKKMMEAIKCSQKENLQEFEYEEFINCNDSDGEENEVIIYEDDDYLIYDLPNTELPDLNTYDTRSSLKPEERHTIDSCSDPNLKSLLLLNRDKNLLLMQLHKKIKDLLLECQKNIEEKNTIINAFVESNKGQTHSTGAWRLAAPYFKDKRLFPCPPNDDVQKKANKELSIYDLYPLKKWTSFECEKLLRAVKCNYNINQQTAVRKKIQEVTQNFNFENREEVLEELQARMEQLSSNESNEVPPLNSDEHIDWLRVADVFLKDKHTASECKSMWHVYLHPQINKSSWTPSENIKLKELAEKYNYQNWDHIAQQLDNNRTGFTVCMNYYSNLHENFKRGEFTYEEDARLLDLIYQYKMGNYIPWVKIVQHFNNRTRSQLHYRYTYYLSQNERRKGKFTDAEDVLLMILVDKFGKNFKKML
ncbi:hypothetical protein NQ317_012394 [Molorchus minor]|uniref:snRNA-activating protein complex subunit 4 n=1 Tax=Molorchus minor TaxID=1323400 RepID=A0ABQ9JIW6_9CUCU|nr:hypothetical protein NQ317_012394 [Molorchus minor]